MLVVFQAHVEPASFMTDIHETETFACNLASLSDAAARHRILAQLNRMRLESARHGVAVTERIAALHVADHQVYYMTPQVQQVLLLCIGQSAHADVDLACAVKLVGEVAR